jgi:hypothetical protein
MQIPIISHRGQKKPWNSIPRIDWTNPLTKGMVFYGYDTGAGLVVDLVHGLRPTVINTTKPPIANSQFGRNSKYVDGGGSYVFPATPAVNSIMVAKRYSIASAWYLTALPSNTFACPFGINDSGSTTQSAILLEQTVTTDMQWSVANTNATPFGTNSINVFHSFLGTNTGAAAQNLYFDGKLATTATLTATVTTTTAQPCFNSNSSGAAGGNFIAGWVYYGIVWDRTITAQEARKLHDDPWCFLIYPEDEMFATLVGTTAAAFNPANSLIYHQWSSVGRKINIIGDR